MTLAEFVTRFVQITNTNKANQAGGFMSGGSYNYLCHANADDLINKTGDIQDMADRLASLGYAQDAAKETQALLLTVRQYENRIQAMKERLHDIWRAVEWWESGDSGEEGVRDALDKYRA